MTYLIRIVGVILLHCYLLTANQTANATVLMILVSPQFVIMGADSRVNYIDLSTHQETSGDAVKIFKSGEYFFGLAGMVGNPGTNFNPSHVIHKHLKTSSNFNDAIIKIKKEIQEEVLTALENQRKTNPKVFNLNKNNPGNILSIGIIGMDNGQPMGYMLGYQITGFDPLTLKEEELICPGSAYPNGMATMYVGETEAVKIYSDSLKATGQISHDPIDFINNSIALQAQSTPKTVGLPADIVAINLHGEVIWIQQKVGCPIEMD